jgi:hypothetical protein
VELPWYQWHMYTLKSQANDNTTIAFDLWTSHRAPSTGGMAESGYNLWRSSIRP